MGRVKIEIKYLENRGNRSATFRKRSNGLWKKARELHVLCGATVELLMIAEDGKQSRYSSAEDQQSLEGVSNCMLENDDEDDEEDDTNDSVTINTVNGGHVQQRQQQQQQQRQQAVEDLGYGGMLQQHAQMLTRGGVQYCQEGIYHGMQRLDPNLVHDNSVIDDFDLYLDPGIIDPAIMVDVNPDDGYVSNPAEHHNCIFNPTEAADSEHTGINEASSTSVSSSMNSLDNQPKPTTRRRTLMKRRKISCNDNNNNHGLMPACSYPAAPVKYELDDGHYQSLRYFTMPDEEDMNRFLA